MRLAYPQGTHVLRLFNVFPGALCNTHPCTAGKWKVQPSRLICKSAPRLLGVTDVICVYVGGDQLNPTYHSIGDHTEGVTVTFDPTQISFADLVDFFFTKASLTSSCSSSKQYQTGIWWHTAEQEAIVTQKITDMEERHDWKITIHRGPLTESGLYRAEEYHQRFFEKNPGSDW